MEPIEQPGAAEQTSLEDIFTGATGDVTYEVVSEEPAAPELPSEPVPPAGEDVAAPTDQPHVSPVEPVGVVPTQEAQPVSQPTAEQPVPLGAEFADQMAQALAKYIPQPQVQQSAQERPQAPDPELDPAGAYQYHTQQAEEARFQDRLALGMDMMRHGVDDFDSVMGQDFQNWGAFERRNPWAVSELKRSQNPARTAYDLLKRDQMVATIGSDGLEAYNKRIIEAHMATLANQQAAPAASGQATPVASQSPQAQTQQAPASNVTPLPTIPQPMGNVRSASPRGNEPASGPMSLEQIFNQG